MTIIDRLLGHDAWTTRQLLLRCRELPDEQMDRAFEIGSGSLRATFAHLIACMEGHTDIMRGRTTGETSQEDVSVTGMLTRLTTAAKNFAEVAARVEREGSADDLVTVPGSGRRRSLGGQVAHLLTHSMHHRAQILYMMEKLGLQDVIEGDALG